MLRRRVSRLRKSRLRRSVEIDTLTCRSSQSSLKVLVPATAWGCARLLTLRRRETCSRRPDSSSFVETVDGTSTGAGSPQDRPRGHSLDSQALTLPALSPPPNASPYWSMATEGNSTVDRATGDESQRTANIADPFRDLLSELAEGQRLGLVHLAGRRVLRGVAADQGSSCQLGRPGNGSVDRR